MNPLLGFQPSEDAPAVRTTLDAALAAFAREDLAEARRAAGAEWACAVAMDVHTGQILLMEAVPDYDPNLPDFGAKSSAASGRKEGIGWLLPAVMALEPGSTAKPFVVAAALAEGVIRRDEHFENFGGTWRLPGRVIHNASEVPNHAMTPREVLVHSSNIGAAQIGMRLGAQKLRALWESLDVNRGIGIPIFDGNRGLFPSDADWNHPSAERWCVASTSYGHAFSLTPVRLAAAWSALVNGGILRQPSLFLDDAPRPGQRVYPEAVAREVSGWLEGVIADRKDKVLPAWPDLRWGGKSGTAKKTHEDGYDLLFTAFGPLPNPEIVVIVVVDNPSNGKPRGSLMSGPSAGRILRRALELRGSLRAVQDLDSRSPRAIVAAR